jgi:uncharacterized protein DUF4258
MSQTFEQIRQLIDKGDIQVSTHADEELTKDRISLRELLHGVQSAVVVEDYPNYAKGPCVLVLQREASGNPIHALWGIKKGTVDPAVLITAYRPDPSRWSTDWLTRKP